MPNHVSGLIAHVHPAGPVLEHGRGECGRQVQDLGIREVGERGEHRLTLLSRLPQARRVSGLRVHPDHVANRAPLQQQRLFGHLVEEPGRADAIDRVVEAKTGAAALHRRLNLVDRSRVRIVECVQHFAGLDIIEECDGVTGQLVRVVLDRTHPVDLPALESHQRQRRVLADDPEYRAVEPPRDVFFGEARGHAQHALEVRARHTEIRHPARAAFARLLRARGAETGHGRQRCDACRGDEGAPGECLGHPFTPPSGDEARARDTRSPSRTCNRASIVPRPGCARTASGRPSAPPCGTSSRR